MSRNVRYCTVISCQLLGWERRSPLRPIAEMSRNVRFGLHLITFPRSTEVPAGWPAAADCPPSRADVIRKCRDLYGCIEFTFKVSSLKSQVAMKMVAHQDYSIHLFQTQGG